MTSPGARLLTLGLLAFVIAIFSYTQADPDLWGHVLFGRDVAVSGTVSQADPYSFTTDRPWVNHEWLAEVAMYEAWRLGGTAGLVALKTSLLLLMLGTIVSTLPRAITPEGLALATGIVVVGALPQTIHLRPQLLSLLLFALLLRTLTRGWGRPGRDRALDVLLMLGIMAVWANVHGGWIVGAGTLLLWTAISSVQRRSVRERTWLVLASGAAIFATMANPYGWRLWQFLAATVQLGRDDIVDWQPVYRMGGAFVVLWAALAGLTVVGIRRSAEREHGDVRAAAVAALLGILAFRVNRLMAFFAIATSIGFGPWIADLVSATARPSASPAPLRRVTAVAAGLALVIAAAAAAVTYQNVSCIRVDRWPVPDAQSTAALASSSLRGRLLTPFDWGQYAIWFLAPRLKVSLDGRRETVYSMDTLEKQRRLAADPEANAAVLEELQPDFAWLPPGVPLVTALEAAGWTPLFTSSRAIVLSRLPAPALISPGLASPQRCFPGP